MGEILCGIGSHGKGPTRLFHKKILRATIKVRRPIGATTRGLGIVEPRPIIEPAMELNGKVVVVTGAARGIGRALATRFAAEPTRAVVAVDIDGDGAASVAADIGATS